MVAAESSTPVSIDRYKRRLPVKCNKPTNPMLPKLFATLRIVAVRSGAIGLSYALNTCTMNGVIAIVPLNAPMKNSDVTMINALIVLRCLRSRNFSIVVGNGCEHFWFCLMHNSHDFDCWLYRCRASNSFVMDGFWTQPRSQQSALSASTVRPVDSNHNGVSGIFTKNVNQLAKWKSFNWKLFAYEK